MENILDEIYFIYLSKNVNNIPYETIMEKLNKIVRLDLKLIKDITTKI
jgi:hypothetical protein